MYVTDEDKEYLTKQSSKAERLSKSNKKRKKRLSKDEIYERKWN